MQNFVNYDATKDEVKELLSQLQRPEDIPAILAGYDDLVKNYGYINITTYLRNAVKSFNR